MSVSDKVLITGAGRAGTSFLVTVLTHAGLDTGYTPDTIKFDSAIRAGGEIMAGTLLAGTVASIVKQLHALPRIIKTPDMSFVLSELYEHKLVHVEHLFFPIRDSKEAARSRLSAGLHWHADTFAEQLTITQIANGQVIEACVMFDIPYTLMHFPRLVNDWEYTYAKLCNGLPELQGKKRKFKKAFEAATAIHRPHAATYTSQE